MKNIKQNTLLVPLFYLDFCFISALKGEGKDKAKKGKRGGSGKSNDGRGSVSFRE